MATAKTALVNKAALTASYQTLTELLGLSNPVMFKGDTVVDAASGTGVVLKTSRASGGVDVPCPAGSQHEWSAVDSDSISFKGAASGDYIDIVGEEADIST